MEMKTANWNMRQFPLKNGNDDEKFFALIFTLLVVVDAVDGKKAIYE
jgi:hypothetical protein